MRKPSATVDLHTDAFLDDWEDYSPEELLQESIDFMRSNLDAAIYWEMNEIRFIHGKGKGLLKKMVFEELKEYKDNGSIERYYTSYQNEDIVVVVIGI
ncbi:MULTISPECIES: Smr/MutS family protein [unclassified Sphingobacterium]|uniref:Smr/MutS family protein n=1 Tax=unclassified Sphingobacterium TaxID=2609468 RepID=UPI0025E39C9B|nr:MULTISPECIES: Smr/MutS family protein [unclassified Sphingobacterium]